MATSGAGEADLLQILSAIGGALSENAGGSRDKRVRAVEEAIGSRLAGLSAEKSREVLDALEGRFPVRQSPSEEMCLKLQEALKAEKARGAELEAKIRLLEEQLHRGAAEEVRFCLDELTGQKAPPEAGLDDPKKLTAVLGVLAEAINKTIGYANVGLDRWEFKDQKFPTLEEMAAAHIAKEPEALGEALRKDLERVRDFLKAMIKADLQFTPKWCESVQARFARESFEPGVSKSRAWDKYVEFIQTYSFRADLMQGLRTFIDGERQRPAQ